MTDQANNLRNLILSRREKDGEIKPKPSPDPLTNRVITISSGKGGVGKSNFTLNLAIQLSKLGKKVVIIDADFGLANIEVLFGAMSRNNILNVIEGKCNIDEVLLDGPCGVKVLSGGSGFSQLVNINDAQISYLIEKFHFLDQISDIILIDTGAGISKQVIDFIKASNESIIITTPEPTSVTDAYAIIKTIKEQSSVIPQINIVVNRVDSRKEGEEIFEKLNRVCDKFLDIKVHSLGFLPFDSNLIKAVKQQKPVSILYPNAPVTKNIEKISMILANKNVALEESGMKGFMNKLIGIFGTKME